MCQCRLIDYNKCSSLRQDIDSAKKLSGNKGYMRTLFSSQFFLETKTDLRNKVYLNIQNGYCFDFLYQKVCLKNLGTRVTLHSGDKNWNCNLNLTVENHRLGGDEGETWIP